MSETCLWNLVEAVQEASDSDAEAMAALLDLLLRGDSSADRAASL